MYGKSNMETYITICKIDSQGGICCVAQETQTGALYQLRGVEWGGRWDGGSKGRGVSMYSSTQKLCKPSPFWGFMVPSLHRQVWLDH